MEGKKKSCKEWLKEHKVELIIAGIGIGVTVAVILGVKKATLETERLEEVAKSVTENILEQISTEEMPIVSEVAKNVVKRAPHEVSMHVRNLPEGHKPSLEKLAEAKELGICLLPTQTLVDTYNTGEVAA